MGIVHDTDPGSLAEKNAMVAAALAGAVRGARRFSDFCGDHAVTPVERQDLGQYLAFLRARATIRALTNDTDTR